jgi:uncharacterized protein YlxP (DUF503 family)
MIVGCLKLHLQLPGCSSLKEKRGRLKPFLHRMRKTFNVSSAETDHHDIWQSAEISVVTVGSQNGHVQGRLGRIVAWVEESQGDLVLVDESIEVITGWN